LRKSFTPGARLVALLSVASAGLLGSGGLADAQGASPDPVEALNRRFQEVAERTFPSVVQVLVDRSLGAGGQAPRGGDDALEDFHHFFSPGAGPRNRGLGSGFMVPPRGTVVTNAHVLEDAEEIRVRLADGREVPADLVGVSDETDLAVLRIEPALTRPLSWGESSALQPGAIVFALGSPFGLPSSISQGIVSGVGRRGPGDRSLAFLQTDAAINRGNSGGPLVDLAGRVLGVNTWIFSRTGGSAGVGFAIPGDLAEGVVRRLAEGAGPGAWLGIVPGPPPPSGSAGGGVRVDHVLAESPAERAELAPGDRVLAVDGARVGSLAELREVLRSARPGQEVGIATPRGERSVSLAARPAAFQPAWRAAEGSEAQLRDGPLDRREREAVARALEGADCPCPCGRTLAGCFGCSAAKSELSEAERLVRRGLDPATVRRRLQAPVIARVWFDYTDPEGRALVRVLDAVEVRYGALLRVRRRYLPADDADPAAFRAAVNALEVARAAGRYERAHRLLIEAGDAPAADRLRRLVAALELDAADVEAAIRESRFEAQIRKDLTAGPQQYGVASSPALQLDRGSYSGELTLEAISRAVEELILARSL